jgi:hypothetical protein
MFRAGYEEPFERLEYGPILFLLGLSFSLYGGLVWWGFDSETMKQDDVCAGVMQIKYYPKPCGRFCMLLLLFFL